jgi:hypothetical protein
MIPPQPLQRWGCCLRKLPTCSSSIFASSWQQAKCAATATDCHGIKSWTRTSRRAAAEQLPTTIAPPCSGWLPTSCRPAADHSEQHASALSTAGPPDRRGGDGTGGCGRCPEGARGRCAPACTAATPHPTASRQFPSSCAHSAEQHRTTDVSQHLRSCRHAPWPSQRRRR